MATVSFPRGNKDAWASVSEPASGVFVLSMNNLPDNRLLPVRLKPLFLRLLASRRELTDGLPLTGSDPSSGALQSI
jgi:hypothetical protein